MNTLPWHVTAVRITTGDILAGWISLGVFATWALNWLSRHWLRILSKLLVCEQVVGVRWNDAGRASAPVADIRGLQNRPVAVLGPRGLVGRAGSGWRLRSVLLLRLGSFLVVLLFGEEGSVGQVGKLLEKGWKLRIGQLLARLSKLKCWIVCRLRVFFLDFS